VAYAVKDGVAILGLGADDVVASLEAEATGKSLAASNSYREAFSLVGNRSGAEIYVQASPLIEPLVGALKLPAESRAILQHVGALGLTMRGAPDGAEFDALITIH
jgi:hypothetical protein